MAPALPDSVSSQQVTTDRLTTNVLASGDSGGTPVCLVQGDGSSSRFWAEVMADIPDEYRVFAPDLRGYGQSEPKPVDATRGVRKALAQFSETR